MHVAMAFCGEMGIEEKQHEARTPAASIWDAVL